ncbi:peptidoglycan-binding domain-containing protein [Candidatus Pristimantibacillus sp. PTI5]|uniref:peptidoglycan-binding domain-containing protein n=1 Tax=Candidatus Pristimantibacillus sp. PTI5 TaxID=3400422 RepID=UPI003B019D73
MYAHKCSTEYVNSKFTAKEIKELQTNLVKMKIYEGPITGKYDKQTYAAVYGYHMLLENDGRAAIWKNEGVDLGKEGVVTKDLIKFAVGDVGLDRKNTNKYEINSNNLVKAVTIFGIGDGMVSQLAEDGVDFLNAAVQMNPTNLSFWTKTLPEAWSLAKGIATGEITPKELFGELKDSLKQEFIDPFTYIKNHQNVMNGNSTYEEAREFGKNLMRAVEVVAAAVSLGAAGVAKLASKMPKLVGGIKELIDRRTGLKDEEASVLRYAQAVSRW